jgi:hypothetical protein
MYRIFILLILLFILYKTNSEYFTQDKLNKDLITNCKKQCSNENDTIMCSAKCLIEAYNSIHKTNYIVIEENYQ